MPGESLTVDEQLIPNRGRFIFRQYIPNKDRKYGIKMFWCCDSNTTCPLNDEVYFGHQLKTAAAAESATGIGELVKQLVYRRISSDRTATTDSDFTSVEMAEDLLRINITRVGIIGRNKKKIPRQVQTGRQQLEQSATFCFDRQLTLISNIPTL